MNKGLTKGNGFEKGFLVLITAMSFWLGSVASGYAAPMLQFNGGQLTGATGMDVGGTFYDVTLMDGSCVALFGGCDQLSDFPFPDTLATENAYATFGALLTAEPFFYTPGNIIGCSYNLQCKIITPVGFNNFGNISNVVLTLLLTGTSGPSNVTTAAMHDFTVSPALVYGKWTVSQIGAAPVPEPTTMLLFGSGLVGLIGYRMKKARA